MIIPVTNYPEQTFRITLDGTPYRMRVYWSQFDLSAQEIIGNGIEGQWYMDIDDDEGIVSIKAIALAAGADLFEPYAFDQLGGLWIIDRNEKAADPGLNDLGARHDILYVTVADKAAFNASIGYTR